MKKLFGLCAALLCAYQISNAQTNQGSQNLSLNAGYQHTSNTNTSPPGFTTTSENINKNSMFNVGPSYGFFIANGLELGAGLSYSSQSLDYGTTGTGGYSQNNDSHYYGANLFFRKYVLYQNKFGFRFGPSVGYTYGKSNQTNSQVTPTIINGKINTVTANGNFDLVYYPSSHLGIAANLLNLSYVHSKTTGDEPGHTSDFGLNFINTGLYLSVFWALGK